MSENPCTECPDRVNGRCNRDCPFWGHEAVAREVAKQKILAVHNEKQGRGIEWVARYFQKRMKN